MPVYEHSCTADGCELQGYVLERYEHHAVSTDPPCAACGGPTVRIVSSFGVVFTGPITRKYMDTKREIPDKKGDGAHWVWEKKTPDGKPRPRLITTWSEQRDYCKQEGLALPSDMPTNATMSEDGKTLQSRGMPGQW